MITTTNMGLTAWDDPGDYFSHSQLATNFVDIDAHDHTSGKGVQIPAGALANNSVATANIIDGAVTAAKMGNDAIAAGNISSGAVGDSEIGTLPGARVFRASTQSIANTTVSSINYTSERYDTSTFHDNSTNNTRLTVPVNGLYLVTSSVEWAASATGIRGLYLIIGAAFTIASQRVDAAATGVTMQSVSSVYRLTAGDFVETYVEQTSGGALNIVNQGVYSPEFAIQWLSDS